MLEVIYLIFNEGYAASAGDEWIRPELIEEALRLGRILAELLPEEPEVHGLAALMELQASRSRARTGPSGEAIPLDEQDRSRWDWVLIGRGKAALGRAQAAGASAHTGCRRRSPPATPTPAAGDTDWERIAALYDGLAQLTPSPVIELNRAVAVSRAFGAASRRWTSSTACARSPRCPAITCCRRSGATCSGLGREIEARDEFQRAASLARNSRERDVLLGRAAAWRAPLP